MIFHPLTLLKSDFRSPIYAKYPSKPWVAPGCRCGRPATGRLAKLHLFLPMMYFGIGKLKNRQSLSILTQKKADLAAVGLTYVICELFTFLLLGVRFVDNNAEKGLLDILHFLEKTLKSPKSTTMHVRNHFLRRIIPNITHSTYQKFIQRLDYLGLHLVMRGIYAAKSCC